MKVLLVGGNFSEDGGKPSGVITKLNGALTTELAEQIEVVNGGTVDELNAIDLEPYKLIIWMANVDNSQPKKYPVKPKGAVMVISKRLSEGRTDIDAISRIFGMHANAVIAINIDSQIVNGHARVESLKDVGVTEAVVETKPVFTFKLLDALGNSWIETTDVKELATGILAFTKWNSESKRVGTSRFYPDDLAEVVELNKIVADKFEVVKSRYFGNVSTRCMKMSPTSRGDNKIIFVSKRNVSKKRLTVDDMIPVLQKSFNDNNDTKISYFGEHKPSVDTPIQLYIYKTCPKINYMIHGHAYVKDAPFTKDYYPCGDMREVDGAVKLIQTITWRFCDSASSEYDPHAPSPHFNGVMNLKNHGFLIFAETLMDLDRIVNEVELIEREVGESL